jgi:hypothetical protein
METCFVLSCFLETAYLSQYTGPYDITSHKLVMFTVNILRTSDLTLGIEFHWTLTPAGSVSTWWCDDFLYVYPTCSVQIFTVQAVFILTLPMSTHSEFQRTSLEEDRLHSSHLPPDPGGSVWELSISASPHLFCDPDKNLFPNHCSYRPRRNSVSSPIDLSDNLLCNYCGYGLDRRADGVRVPRRARFFFFRGRSERSWGPPRFPSSGYRGLFLRE